VTDRIANSTSKMLLNSITDSTRSFANSFLGKYGDNP